jgi:hypothetical protein
MASWAVVGAAVVVVVEGAVGGALGVGNANGAVTVATVMGTVDEGSGLSVRPVPNTISRVP